MVVIVLPYLSLKGKIVEIKGVDKMQFLSFLFILQKTPDLIVIEDEPEQKTPVQNNVVLKKPIQVRFTK